MKAKKIFAAFMATAMLLTVPVGSFAANEQIIESTFSDPINLNPALSSDSASSDVTGKLFDGLYKRDWNAKIIPATAAALPKIENKGLKLTIPLRKDVKWHDGKPFTSADVKFSIEFILDKKAASPRYANFELIDSVQAPDPYTVVINMKSVDSGLLPTLANPYFIPKHIWEGIDPAQAKQSEYNKSKIIGNGPWKFVEWKAAERVVVESNPAYYGVKPKIKKYVASITPSQAVAMVKAETGESQIVAVPESDIVRMQKNPKLNVTVYDRAVFDCMLYNLKTPYFSDKRVRQAITHAINKQNVVRGIYKGIGSVANGSYHPKLAVYNKDVKIYNYDVNKAKALLDQAGWKMGAKGVRVKDGKEFKFVLLTNKGNIMREKLTVEVQRQLKPLGIIVEPRILEWNTFLEKYVNIGKFDAYVGGFSTGLDGDQTVFYHSDKTKASLNKGYYSNPAVDKLLDAGRATMDPAEQKKIYADLQKIVAEDQPMTYFVYRKAGLAVSKKVQGVKIVDLLGTNGELGNWTIAN